MTGKKPLKSGLISSTNHRAVQDQEKTSASSKHEPQTMEELLQTTGYSLHGFKKGDTIEGKVVSVRPTEILIDIGYKSMGIVSAREMEEIETLLPNLAGGDKVLVQIVSPETDEGQIILSVRRAGMEKKWQELVEKKVSDVVEVTGMEVTRGGLLVDWQGLRGFIPTSQLDPGRGGPQNAIGNKIKVAVLEVDKANNRLVFSEKKVLAPEKLAEKKEALEKIDIGKTYEGKVTALVPFGIFVSLGQIEGLVHISEIAWEKVTNPSDYFAVGDAVKVIVIAKDETSGKLNLSIKQLKPDPWQEMTKQYSIEQAVEGKVTRVSSFGIFVEIAKGIEGLVHISKMPPGVEFKVGDKVNCQIEGIDNQKRKITLSLVLKEKPVGYK